MSGGRVTEVGESERGEFADELLDGESIRLSWTATNVHWADQWGTDPNSPVRFAVTDRRMLFETADGVASIGLGRVRAIGADETTDLDLSLAFLACGGLCLVVGGVTFLRDFANGAGLVALSVALLVSGAAMRTTTDSVTATVVVGNERQRLSFDADETTVEDVRALVTDS